MAQWGVEASLERGVLAQESSAGKARQRRSMLTTEPKCQKNVKGHSSAYIPKGLSQRKSTREDKRETLHHHKRGRTVCTCVLRGRWHTFPKWDADELLRYAKREAAPHRSAALLCVRALTRNPNCTPTTKFLGLLYSREWRMLADAKCV